MYRKKFFYILVISILSILLYTKTISFSFLNWDDDIHVYNNPAFGSVAPIRDIWTTFKTLSYLPIAHSFFYLQWRISHSPHFFHLINILLHLINLFLIFVLLLRLKIDLAPAFFITLIYAVHPMRVETVAWISEQKGLISGIFVWLSFLAYIAHSKKGNVYFFLLTNVFYISALLSKQTAFPLVFVLLACRYFISEDKRLKRYLSEILILGGIGIGIMSIHWIRESQHFIGTTADYLPIYIRSLLFFKSFTYYILKTILPFNLCPIYPRWEFFQDFVGDLLPVITIIFFTLWIILSYKRKQNPFAGWLIFGYTSYLFTIFPVTGIFTMPYMNTSFIADRYSYFPGLFITIIFVLTVINYFKRYAYAILKIFSFLCILSTCVYTQVWKEPIIFWNYIIDKNPEEDTSYTNLSYYYIHKEGANTEDYLQAISLAQKAMILNPDNPIGYYNYGTCLMKLGRIKEVERYFRKSLKIKPDYSDVWNDLGYLFELEGKTQDAIASYKKALEYNPNHKVAQYNLDRLLFYRRGEGQG